MRLQVVVNTFDDADLLERALASLPTWMEVHVVDGRHANFPGDHDTTPASREVCGGFDHVTYHAPPPGLLPFGHQDEHLDGELRAPQWRKASWVNEDVLDPDVWTLRLDADERLVRFTPGDLEADKKYVATLHIEDHATKPITGDVAYVPRLWLPRSWTFWTGDLQVPREAAPQNGLLAIKAAIDQGEYKRGWDMSTMEDIVIHNDGHERPTEYLERRQRQLDRIYGVA